MQQQSRMNLAWPAIVLLCSQALTAAPLALSFERNLGQFDTEVRYFCRGAGYFLALKDADAVLGVAGRKGHLRMRLVGANHSPRARAVDELPGRVNYYAGSDPVKWRSGVPTYARVVYENLYPGIDLAFYGRGAQWEYDFIVSPGADPRGIRISLEGTRELRLAADGVLEFGEAELPIRQLAPVVYQWVNGAKKVVTGRYVLKGKHEVTFEVDAHDRSRELVIDPVVVYSTVVGGSGQPSGGFAPGPSDWGAAVAVDAAGNAYLAGRTVSTDFVAGNTAAPHLGGTADAFVAKLNPAGTALLYVTYLGGSQDDRGGAIAIDASGNAVAAGTTWSNDFPTTAGVFQTAAKGATDAFVARLDSAGALVYSSYLGGSDSDSAAGIAMDRAGNAYVTDQTVSLDFPVTAGVVQNTYGGGAGDAFVAKIDPLGRRLAYSTYVGGDGSDPATGIVVDSAGNALVAGDTFSTNFPVTVGALQTRYAGGDAANPGSNAYVAKLDATGARLIFSTYLGGSGERGADGIALDGAGSVFVAGGAVTPASGSMPASGAVFVAKLDASGSRLVYEFRVPVVASSG